MEQFETQALELHREYNKLVITDSDSFVAMGAYEKTAKEAVALIKANMKSSIEEAHQRHKKLVVTQKKLIAPFEEVRVGARRKRLEYQAEQERIAQEAQRKAEEEARRLAEQKRQEEIEEAEAFESEEKTKALKQAPVEVPAVQVKSTAKVKGARTLWHAEVVSLKQLAAAIATGTVPESYIMPNMSVLNNLAVRDKERFSMPGVVAVSKVV